MKELINYTCDIIGQEQHSKENMIALELHLLCIDCRDIVDAICVYNQLTSEELSANKFLFLEYYETVETSIVYRIIMGLCRLFDNNTSARTLKKILNTMQQTKSINKNAEINTAITEVLFEDKKIREIFNFKNLRDKYFAHLDKEMVYSSLIIFKNLEHTDELAQLLTVIIELLYNLYYKCFGEKISKPRYTTIEVPNVANLKDVKQRAFGFLDEFPVLRNSLGVNESGLYFLFENN